MQYLIITDMAELQTNGIWHYSGLDSKQFDEIRYTVDLSQVAISTNQTVPETLQKFIVTKNTYNQIINTWEIPNIVNEPDDQTPNLLATLGQFIVQQTLKNAELEQKIDAVGQGVVQLMLK